MKNRPNSPKTSRSLKWFFRLHVFSQNLVVYLALALLPVLLITLLVVTVFFRTMSREVRRSLSNSISQLAVNVQGIVSQIDDTSTTLVNSERVQGYLTALSEKKQVTRPETFSAEQGIAIFFDGALMRSINLYDLTGLPLQFPQQLPDDWLLVVRHRDDAFRHRPIWIHDEESELIHVLRPVESSRNYNRIGYLDITLYAQVFQRLFADLDFGGGGQIALYDEKGKIITGSFPDEDLARKALSCQEDTCELALDGTYLFARKIPSLGWTVVSSISRREAHGSVLRLIGYVLLAIIFLTMMVFVLSLSYARYTRKRIQYLVDAMNQFAQGAHEVAVPLDDNPEFRQLYLHFNEMVRRIDHLIDSEYKSKLLQNQAEMKMLEAQINPHFLHNTLNVIYWKAQISHQEDIARISIALSELLHVGIDRKVEYLTLRDELQNVGNYLLIQRMRYQDKVSVQVDVPKALFSCLIPKLVIQPVVENAFIHGLEPKKGKGTLTLTAREEGKDLVVSVSDDGIGMDEEKTLHLLVEQKEKSFQGLLNVHRRLQLAYGEGYGVSVCSEPGKGTKVEIRLRKEEGGHVPGTHSGR